MSRDKVVITGIGAVTPNGNNVNEFWTSLTNGISGIGPITYFDSSNHRVKIAGELNGFQPDSILDPKEIKKLDTFAIYALVATQEEISMSGLDSESLNPDRIGVTIGTGVGGIQTLEDQQRVIDQKGARRVSPQFVPKMIANIAGGHLSIRWGLRGPNQTVTSACASATDAIGMAMRLILSGDADAMVTGGTEASVTALTIAGFANMKALSQSNETPERASRPFDKDRDGFVLGEGSGMLVIERESHAKNRGAHILAELAGYGSTDDAFHITQPSKGGAGALKAMERAIKDAGLNIDDIDYVNAHGTSTPVGDMIELSAVEKLFGSRKGLYMSSNKSAIGHLLGAAGAVEAVFSLKSLNTSILPPTLNLDNPETSTKINLIPINAINQKINNVISNSFGFGGTNASLIFGN